MGLKVGDFLVIGGLGNAIGYIEHIDDNNMAIIKWQHKFWVPYGFRNGESYSLTTLEKSGEKIPDSDIKKIGDNYYIKEKCYISSYYKNGKIGSKIHRTGHITIKNPKITSKIKYFLNHDIKPIEVYLIYKLVVHKGGLDVVPFKFIIKTNLKSKEKIKINV